MKKISSYIVAATLLLPNNVFAYNTQHWSDDSIKFLQEQNILKSYPQNLEKELTREEFIEIFAKEQGYDGIKQYPCDLKDIENLPSKGAISYLYHKKILSGYPDKTFRPKNKITKQEAIALIYKSLETEVDFSKVQKKTFLDINNSWAKNMIESLAGLGIISGYEGKFNPNSNMKTGENISLIASVVTAKENNAIIEKENNKYLSVENTIKSNEDNKLEKKEENKKTIISEKEKKENKDTDTNTSTNTDTDESSDYSYYSSSPSKPNNEEEKPNNEGKKPNNEEEKPNNEGEKPNNEGEKPSNEGEKPNNEGEKPSNEGEKPSNEEEKPNNGEINPISKTYNIYVYTCSYDKKTNEYSDYSNSESMIEINSNQTFEDVRDDIELEISEKKVDFLQVAENKYEEIEAFYSLNPSDDMIFKGNGAKSDKDIVIYAVRYKVNIDELSSPKEKLKALIDEAESLKNNVSSLDEEPENVNNGEKYVDPNTYMSFLRNIRDAKSVLNSEDGNDEYYKEAFDDLTQEIDEFKAEIQIGTKVTDNSSEEIDEEENDDEGYNLKVVNGYATVKGKRVTKVEYGDIVTIVAKDTDNFDYWSVKKGNVKLGSKYEDTTFTMPEEDVVIVALGLDENDKDFDADGNKLNNSDDTSDSDDENQENPIIQNYTLYFYSAAYNKDTGDYYDDVDSNKDLIVRAKIKVSSNKTIGFYKDEIEKAIEKMDKQIDIYKINGVSYTKEELYDLKTNDKIQSPKYKGDIVLWALRYQNDSNVDDIEAEEVLPIATLNQLRDLVSKVKIAIDDKRIKEDGLSDLKIALSYSEKLLQLQDPPQEEVNKRYYNLSKAFEENVEKDYNGKAFVVISGFSKEGKLIKGSGFNSNTGLKYYHDSRLIEFTEHGNMIDNLNVLEKDTFKFKVEYIASNKLYKITHNGNNVEFVDNGLETEDITINLSEGPNRIVIDYREKQKENLTEPFNKMVTTDEGKNLIDSNGKLKVFDVRTIGEYNESHIEGVLNSDIYKENEFNTYVDKLDKDETYLIYCRTDVRSKKAAEIMQSKGFKYIYWMQGGMTKWLKENKPAIFSDAPKMLDVEVNNIQNKDNNLSFDIAITDIKGNPMVKSSAQVSILKDNQVVQTKEVKMDNKEKQNCTFDKAGENENYTIKVLATLGEYKECEILVSVNEEKIDEFDEDDDKFSHLKDGTKEKEIAPKIYGRHFEKYKVLDEKQSELSINSKLTEGKPSVLVFGYPGCGGCVNLMQEISQLIGMNNEFLDKFNYLEIVTSVDMNNPSDTINFTKKLLKQKNMENLSQHLVFDGVDYIWQHRMGLTTTPNIVLLDEYGRVINISHQLKPQQFKDLLKSTYNIDLGENIPEPASDSKSVVVVGGSADNEIPNKGDNVTITAMDKDIFVEWVVESGDITINDKKSPTATFIMGSEKVSIKARYKSKQGQKLSLKERQRLGQYRYSSNLHHLIKEYYGTDLSNMKIQSLEGKNTTLGKIVDSKRPVVVIEGGLYCGICQNKWRDMSKYINDFGSINLVFLVQSVDGTYNISDIKKFLKDNNAESLYPYMYLLKDNNPVPGDGVPEGFILDRQCHFTNMPYGDASGRYSQYNKSLISISETIGDSISVKED